jgi:hypothetical protein
MKKTKLKTTKPKHQLKLVKDVVKAQLASVTGGVATMAIAMRGTCKKD